MIGGNFSELPYNCKVFSDAYVAYSYSKYSGFNGKVADFLLAFLFNLMGNALKFK